MHSCYILMVVGHGGPPCRVVRTHGFFSKPRRVLLTFIGHRLIDERQPKGPVVTVGLESCVPKFGKPRLPQARMLGGKTTLSRWPSIAPSQPMYVSCPDVFHANLIPHQRCLLSLEDVFPVEIQSDNRAA